MNGYWLIFELNLKKWMFCSLSQSFMLMNWTLCLMLDDTWRRSGVCVCMCVCEECWVYIYWCLLVFLFLSSLTIKRFWCVFLVFSFIKTYWPHLGKKMVSVLLQPSTAPDHELRTGNGGPLPHALCARHHMRNLSRKPLNKCFRLNIWEHVSMNVDSQKWSSR